LPHLQKTSMKTELTQKEANQIERLKTLIKMDCHGETALLSLKNQLEKLEKSGGAL